MKKHTLKVSELLEIKAALKSLATNPKIPIMVIMNLNEVKNEIQPLLDIYSETKVELDKRFAIKGEDANNTPIDIIDPDKVLDYSDEHKILLDKTHEVRLPEFNKEELGYDPKKPNGNKFEITPGAIFGLGVLIVKKKASVKKD